MELKKLDQSFYVDNPKVEQDLDFDSQLGTWNSSKTRGHGIVKITINGLTFAIPVRSYIKHNASYILEVNRQGSFYALHHSYNHPRQSLRKRLKWFD